MNPNTDRDYTLLNYTTDRLLGEVEREFDSAKVQLVIERFREYLAKSTDILDAGTSLMESVRYRVVDLDQLKEAALDSDEAVVTLTKDLGVQAELLAEAAKDYAVEHAAFKQAAELF
jgi:hypothetical protein